MKPVIFYEKPGCSTNTKQKKALQNAGCMLIVKNLLDHQLNQDELLSYLEKKAVSEWFNPNAPAIKKGEIDPSSFTQEDALKLLLDNPILIRRPLMGLDGYKMCGFDRKVIEDIIDVSLDIAEEEKCTSNTACPPPVSSSTSK